MVEPSKDSLELPEGNGVVRREGRHTSSDILRQREGRVTIKRGSLNFECGPKGILLRSAHGYTQVSNSGNPVLRQKALPVTWAKSRTRRFSN